MRLTHDELLQLTKDSHFPRALTETGVLLLDDRRRPDHDVALVVDAALWENDLPLGTMFYSMNVDMARLIVAQLGVAIEAVEAISDGQ